MPREPRRVLVTGAGSGIGRALAIRAATRGMRVALAGRRPEALAETLAMMEGDGHLCVPGDITLPGDRGRIVATVGAAWPALHVLVNNAGIVEGGPLETMDDAALARIIGTNVVGPIAMTRDLLPMLERARPSRVVNVGSVFGDIAYPLFAPYSASKFALRGFSSALRRECRARGVSVTYAAPRATRTAALAAVAAHIPGATNGGDRPDRVAERIWRAVDRGANSVYAPGRERLFILLQQCLPGLIDLALSRPQSRTA